MRFATLATAAIVGLLISLATPSANAAAPGALGKSWARTAAVLAAQPGMVEKVHRRRYRHRHRYRRYRPRIFIPRGIRRHSRRHRHYHCHRRRCHRHRHRRGHHR